MSPVFVHILRMDIFMMVLYLEIRLNSKTLKHTHAPALTSPNFEACAQPSLYKWRRLEIWSRVSTMATYNSG